MANEQDQQPVNANDPRFNAPGITSVNDTGARPAPVVKQLMFLALCVGLVVIAGLWYWNHSRDVARRAEAAAAAEERKAKANAAKGLAVPKRDFAAERAQQEKAAKDHEARSKDKSAVATATVESKGTPCPDVVMMDAAGRPVLHNGVPVKVDCRGAVIPAIDPSMMPVSTAGVSKGGANAAQTQNAPPAPKPPSRYAGDVILPPPQGATAGAISNSTATSTNPTDRGVAMVRELMQAQQARQPGSPAGSTITLTPPTGASGLGAPTGQAAPPPTLPTAGQGSGALPNQQGLLGPLLQSTTGAVRVSAQKFGNRDLTLAQGYQVNCALTTRLVTEVSGYASCVLTDNAYSESGKVVLLERGSEAMGEYVAQGQAGQRRLFVLWNRVKTPKGVIVNLASPAADGLGTMGVPGYVDNRWFERLGGALLLSIAKDAITFGMLRGTQGVNTNGGGIVFQQSARSGESAVEQILKSTIGIKPTLYANQGDVITIYVARDVDFTHVYNLRML